MKYAILLILMLGLCACPNEPTTTDHDSDGDGHESPDSDGNGHSDEDDDDADDSNGGSDSGGAPPTRNIHMQVAAAVVDAIIARIKGEDDKDAGMALASLPSNPQHFEKHPELIPRVRDTLIGVVNSEMADFNRAFAIGKLMEMGEHAKPIMPRLIELIDHPIDGQHVTHNLVRLGKVGHAAIPRMIEILDAGAERKHINIIDGLYRLGADAAPAVPVLTKILKENTNEFMRMKASMALGAIGKAASSALPILDELTETGGGNLGFRAKQAADAIRAAE